MANFISMAFFELFATITLYNAIASLANAIALNTVLPIGSNFWKELGASIKFTETSHQINEVLSATSDDTISNELVLDNGTDETKTNNDALSDFVYPNDDQVMGQSDFKTPHHSLFLGLSIYSALFGIGMLANSETVSFQGLIANLLVQGHTVVICASRGQTSFGFYLLPSH